MTLPPVLLSVVVLALLSGCSASLDRNPSERCDSSGACSAGGECVRGFCLDSLDGASPGDGGLDAGPVLPPCSGGDTRCGLRCTSLVDDDAHCGSCDVACGSRERCRGGVCERR